MSRETTQARGLRDLATTDRHDVREACGHTTFMGVHCADWGATPNGRARDRGVSRRSERKREKG
jgi:hypothetical protein